MATAARMPWLLIGATGLMELGWLAVAVAIRDLTEAPPVTNALIDGLPQVWGWTSQVRLKTHDPSAIALTCGLLMVCGGYVAAIVSALRWRGPGKLGWICAASGLMALTLVLLPGTLSSDVLAYGVYGRLAGVYGLNPYVTGPSAIPDDVLVQWLGGNAQHASPYGPLWTLLSSALAVVCQSLPAIAVAFAYRGLGVVAHAANAFFIWRLAPARTLAVALYALNPLVLFEVIASGHNDGLMLSLVLGGLLLASSRRWWLIGAALIWAATFIKWIPIVVLVYLTLVSIKTLSGWRRRAQRALAVVAVGLVMALALFAPWLDVRTPSGFLAGATAGAGERYVNTLMDLPTLFVAQRWVDPRGLDLAGAESTVRVWESGLARLGFLAYFAFEIRHMWRRGASVRDVVQSSTRTLLLVLLVALNQVLAWYFIWPLCLGVTLGWQSALARLTVAYSLVYLPVFYALHENLVSSQFAPLLVLGYVLVPLLAVGRWPLAVSALRGRDSPIDERLTANG